jgi:hypothetical protein
MQGIPPKPLARAALLALLAVPPIVSAGYIETWDDPVARHNDWFFFQNGADAEDHEGDAAMGWSNPGGDGVVITHVGNASDWDVTPGIDDRYVAYTWGEYHAVDLTADRYLDVGIRTGFAQSDDLIRFWVGRWIDDNNYGFYTFDQPLLGGTGFTRSIIELDHSSWTPLATKGTAPTVAALLPDPEQWGFVLIRAGGLNPIATVELSHFGSLNARPTIPLPAPLLLLGPGMLWLGLRRRPAARAIA